VEVASLEDLLHETAEHHGSFEAVAAPHNWWGLARGIHGRSPEREHTGGGLRSRGALHVK
jgi:hypothetical protein